MAGIKQEDIQPGDMKVWTDPFDRPGNQGLNLNIPLLALRALTGGVAPSVTVILSHVGYISRRLAGTLSSVFKICTNKNFIFSSII
jgi:hypothetical protein